MRVMELKAPGGLHALRLAERPDPVPAEGEIVVRVRATSLNFHDLAVVTGGLRTEDLRIPMSDGAGEVLAVGPGASRFSVGDRVISTFFPRWTDGPATREKLRGIPGEHVDGFAAELVVMSEAAFTRAPVGYDFEQAATLPCAALTAFRALFVEKRLRPGEWVLVQGSGGVSIFALQFAKAVGARVIATSSSPEKLERLLSLGADHVIDYRKTPDWGKQARSLTRGRGVDEVVEIGGAGTLAQSLAACRVGGHVSVIGVVAGAAGEISVPALFSSNLTLSGITVGSRSDQEDMVAALEAWGLRPVVERSFPLAELPAAFAMQAAQRHVGKICVSI